MRIVVLGSGDWGLTLARVLCQDRKVVVWAKDDEELSRVKRSKAEAIAGGGLELEVKYRRRLRTDDIVLVAVPSAVMRPLGRELGQALEGAIPTVVSASKGLEQPGFKTMSQVLREELPGCRIGVISGPTIAREVAEGKPAKAVLAADDIECLLRLKQAFDNRLLHFELSLCVVEVEFCAALKGVMAIGAGIADGLGLGKNFLGLLLTYGLHEILAIGRFLGISTQQVLGIAGLGDLIATCWSTDSRNHRFGVLLAAGTPRQEALEQVGMVVEGVRVANDVARLASLNVPVHIINSIAGVIEEPTEANLAEFRTTVLEYRSVG